MSEDADDRAPAGLVERVEEHLLALLVNQIRLIQEGILVDDPLVERRCIFRQSERRVASLRLRQVDGVGERMRNG